MGRDFEEGVKGGEVRGGEKGREEEKGQEVQEEVVKRGKELGFTIIGLGI